MGSKRVGLARTQALIENLKRSLTLGTSTISCASVTATSGDVAITAGNLAITSGIIIEELDNTAEAAQNVSLSAAEFKKGLVTHASTTGGGTITIDTAANLISTLGLTADNMTAHCYYMNTGNQDVIMEGTIAGITYADTSAKIKENCCAILLARRTGSGAVTMYIVGGQ